MLLASLGPVAGLLVGFALAQSSTTTTAVPTGTPVAGSYNGPARPQVHFSPPQGFMNDPNGMFRDDNGLWHLYYQYDPTSLVAGNQHWGHATSTDLYHWENQQIALFPPEPTTYVFSGSAVIDPNNTSGFFPNQTNGVVAIYTLAEYVYGNGVLQNQNIAYSIDGGYTFTPYSSNPVLDIGSAQFRDPKVIWHSPTQKWIMVVSYATEFTIGIFTSPNLKNWTHASNFTHAGLLGLQYECPNMVELPVYASPNSTSPSGTMYILQISINPGAPLGGSISQYFPGTFNGTDFVAVDAAARVTDFSKDNYAGQFFYNIPATQPQVSIAWASNWQYSQVVPTGSSEGWRSAMSLPRLNYLTNITQTGWDLVSAPYDLTPVLGPTLASNSSLGNGTLLADFSTVASNAIYFSINITSIPTANTTGSLNVTILSSLSGESLQLGQLPLGGDLFVSRRNTYGFAPDNPFFTDKFSVTNLVDPVAQSFTLEGVVDRSLLEVFANAGEKAATVSFFTEQPLDTVIVKTAGLNPGVGVSAEVRGLVSAWAQYENSTTGVVVGNVTTTAGGGGNGTQASRRAVDLRGF